MRVRKPCKKLGLFTVLFIAALFTAQSLEWPLSQAQVLRGFGQREEGGVGRGLLLEGEGTARAAGDGVLLITIEENRNMTGFPSALGNAVLIAHGDGIVSVTANLDSASIPPERDASLETGAVIARTGESAWEGGAARSDGRGVCIFQVIDQKQNALLNPLLLLPPMEDAARPSIREASLVSRDGSSYSLSSARVIPAGSYRVYAAVSDTYSARSPTLAPFRVTVLVNGREASSLSFDTMTKKDSALIPTALPQYFDGSSSLYNEEGAIYAGNVSLSRGRNELSIAARDFAGNERAAAFMLQVE